jgi:osmoprotectant transport system permease protein
MRRFWPLLVLALAGCTRRAEPLKIGSKQFTESVILGEMGAYLARDAGFDAVHRRELGGTQFLWQALLKGEIDAYPEYTGTIRKDILKSESANLDKALAVHGVGVSQPLGFNNSYALGMRADLAKRLGIQSITDLRKHPDLRFGFSQEFFDRSDGWKPLKRKYSLNVPNDAVGILQHEVALTGLAEDKLDVTDVYTTEGGLKQYDMVALKDDRHFFPAYDAVWVYRSDLSPERLAPLLRLQGSITSREMTDLNSRVQPGVTESRVAADFLREKFDLRVVVEEEGLTRRLLRLTGQHLFLVGVSLGLAVLVAVPLGIVATRQRHLGQVILGTVGLLQTIPSLALLVFFIPLLGLGAWTAIAALFLYSLLPIVRNTHAGLSDISPSLRESAQALGLSCGAILRLIELPLASRSILAGIKIAAVINVGTATLGALIDAGGYGQPIFSGIRLGDRGMILQGAVPAAVLALLVQGLFEILERTVTPRGLRLKPSTN